MSYASLIRVQKFLKVIQENLVNKNFKSAAYGTENALKFLEEQIPKARARLESHKEDIEALQEEREKVETISCDCSGGQKVLRHKPGCPDSPTYR